MPDTTKLTEELATTVQWLRESAEAGADAAGPFLAEQTPLYIEELIRWEITSNLALGFVTFVLFILAVYALLRFMKQGHKDRDSWDEWKLPWVFGSIASGLLALLMLIAVVEYAYAAAHPYVAPRVFVVDKLAEVLP